MSRFYVGQRVKKVRGVHALGSVAVYLGPARFGYPGADGHVEMDKPQRAASGRYVKRGDIHTSQWEPVVPPHEACDYLFKLELDEMLARHWALA